MPPIFAAVLEYAFPEDGDLVALGIHGHGTDQEGGSGSYMVGDRPVLAELEGIVLANPTTKKVSSCSHSLPVMPAPAQPANQPPICTMPGKNHVVGQADWATP